MLSIDGRAQGAVLVGKGASGEETRLGFGAARRRRPQADIPRLHKFTHKQRYRANRLRNRCMDMGWNEGNGLGCALER